MIILLLLGRGIFLSIFPIAAFYFNVRVLIFFTESEAISDSDIISEFPAILGRYAILGRKYNIVVLGPSSTTLFFLIAFLTILFSFFIVA